MRVPRGMRVPRMREPRRIPKGPNEARFFFEELFGIRGRFRVEERTHADEKHAVGGGEIEQHANHRPRQPVRAADHEAADHDEKAENDEHPVIGPHVRALQVPDIRAWRAVQLERQRKELENHNAVCE
eukprot:scaffold20399_cov60-Phaeocystis_antarctica.AAC.4